MAITNCEFLNDRVVVNAHLSTSMGCQDLDTTVEVPYAAIDLLPPVPEHIGQGEVIYFNIDVPQVKGRVTFAIVSYMDACVGPSEETLYGPYRAQL